MGMLLRPLLFLLIMIRRHHLRLRLRLRLLLVERQRSCASWCRRIKPACAARSVPPEPEPEPNLVHCTETLALTRGGEMPLRGHVLPGLVFPLRLLLALAPS
jgi:hypothetical protein